MTFERKFRLNVGVHSSHIPMRVGLLTEIALGVEIAHLMDATFVAAYDHFVRVFIDPLQKIFLLWLPYSIGDSFHLNANFRSSIIYSIISEVKKDPFLAHKCVSQNY